MESEFEKLDKKYKQALLEIKKIRESAGGPSKSEESMLA